MINKAENANKWQDFIENLRDLFVACDSATFQKNLQNLALLLNLPKDTNFQELEYEFMRFFVGPEEIYAPPYASIYLDTEPLLMGKSTLEIKELMQSLGFAKTNGIPEDFLAFELEIWRLLSLLAEQKEQEQTLQESEVQNSELQSQELESQELQRSAKEALTWLVTEHLALWLPQFLERAYQAKPSPSLQIILQNLAKWLENQCQNLKS